ncbi:MAG: protein kinase [Moorea sp. SIO4A1]|uniref:serine/threonine protein kinase n=1 Tax=Moorena sp. SIO4A1 TaxID=2607835 RepID=UPI001450AEF5|nr:serine/threonine protein kinase [Moorena sp. SIO4A1]NEQ56914.1 protein kinase [Moorena sp. SIO4A1]
MNPKLLNNRYRVLETLGSGGFGDTFLAEDIHMPSRRRCVIKQLKALAHNSKAYKVVQERFQREAAVLEALGEAHDQIPRLYAYFSEAEKFYLVQEWIRGNTFTTQVRQGKKFTEIEVRELLISLLKVLEYVHSRRIIHRDIKPDNIIIRQRDGVPVLIDFGAVKEAMSTVVTNSGTPHPASIIIGTPGYMSSEQSAGHPTYSSDLYSLGLTAILLLTGKIPQLFHTDERTGEILWRQDAPHLYSNLGIVLDKAIRFHPRDRFISARQMLDALQSDPASPTEATVPMSPGVPSTANKGTVATVPISPGEPPANNGSVSTIKGPYPVTVKQNDSYKAVLKGGLIGGGILLIVVAVASGFNKFLNPSTTVPSYDQSKSTSYPDKPSSQEPQDKKVSSKDPLPETPSYPSQSQTNNPSQPVTKPETPSYPSQSQTKDRSSPSQPETTVTDPVTPSSPSQPDSTVTDPVTPSSPSQPDSTVTDPVTPSSPSQPDSTVTDPVTPSSPSQPDTTVTDPVTPTSPSQSDTTVKPVPVTTPKPITEPSPIVENKTSNPNLAQLNAIPKFPPGTQRRAVEYALGKPTKQSNGMWKTRAFLYKNVVPNHVDLGYLFDRSSGRLRQTEVTFSQSVDLEIMSETLNKLLSNNISTDIKQGLKDVYQGESKTYKFSSGNNNSLEGVIQRDGSDRIYIGVWEADLK